MPVLYGRARNWLFGCGIGQSQNWQLLKGLSRACCACLCARQHVRWYRRSVLRRRKGKAYLRALRGGVLARARLADGVLRQRCCPALMAAWGER